MAHPKLTQEEMAFLVGASQDDAPDDGLLSLYS